MSERGDRSGPTLSGARYLTPAEARQDAADRLVGRRTLLVLRVVAVITAVTFGTIGILKAFDVVDSKSYSMVVGTAFAMLGVAGLVVVILCRRPARREVFWLKEAISAASWLPIIIGGIGLLGLLSGFNATLPNLVFAVSVVSGLTTRVLLFIWRAR